MGNDNRADRLFEEAQGYDNIGLGCNYGQSRRRADNSGRRKYWQFGEWFEAQDPKPNMMFIVGGRSTGKSWSTAEYIAKDCIENGHKFLLISRWLPQARMKNDYFPPHLKIKMRKYGAIAEFFTGLHGGSYGGKDESIGYNLMLGSASNFKSSGIEGIKWILFEEFTEADPNHYRNAIGQDEWELFKSILGTNYRGADLDLKGGHVVFIGNTDTGFEVNPFFQAINPDFDYTSIKEGETHTIKEWDYDGKVMGRCVVHKTPMGIDNPTEQLHWTSFIDGNEIALTGEGNQSPIMFDMFRDITGARIKGNNTGYIVQSGNCFITFENSTIYNKEYDEQCFVCYTGKPLNTGSFDLIKCNSEFLVKKYEKLWMCYNILFKDAKALSYYNRFCRSENFKFEVYIKNLPNNTEADNEVLGDSSYRLSAEDYEKIKFFMELRR